MLCESECTRSTCVHRTNSPHIVGGDSVHALKDVAIIDSAHIGAGDMGPCLPIPVQYQSCGTRIGITVVICTHPPYIVSRNGSHSKEVVSRIAWVGASH